jgi:hypothetical protein
MLFADRRRRDSEDSGVLEQAVDLEQEDPEVQQLNRKGKCLYH